MTIEQKIVNGNLEIMRSGIIIANLGNARGVNPESEKSLKATRVKYISKDEIPEKGKMHGDFVFYGKSLPEDIEGREFVLFEKRRGDDEKEFPLEQYLVVFGFPLAPYYKRFMFPED